MLQTSQISCSCVEELPVSIPVLYLIVCFFCFGAIFCWVMVHGFVLFPILDFKVTAILVDRSVVNAKQNATASVQHEIMSYL